MEDHTALPADIRTEMRDLRSDMRSDMASLRSDVASFRSEMRSEMASMRLTVEGGFSRLDQKIDRHFMWLVGIVLTAFTAVFAAFIGVTYR